MGGQDNESLKSRVSKAVFEAVLEAGRARPDAADVHLNVNEVLDGMCDAMATFAGMVAQMPEDHAQGADLLGMMEERIVSRLGFLAERVRSGELAADPPVRPKPRLVT